MHFECQIIFYCTATECTVDCGSLQTNEFRAPIWCEIRVLKEYLSISDNKKVQDLAPY